MRRPVEGLQEKRRHLPAIDRIVRTVVAAAAAARDPARRQLVDPRRKRVVLAGDVVEPAGARGRNVGRAFLRLQQKDRHLRARDGICGAVVAAGAAAGDAELEDRLDVVEERVRDRHVGEGRDGCRAGRRLDVGQQLLVDAPRVEDEVDVRVSAGLQVAVAHDRASARRHGDRPAVAAGLAGPAHVDGRDVAVGVRAAADVAHLVEQREEVPLLGGPVRVELGDAVGTAPVAAVDREVVEADGGQVGDASRHRAARHEKRRGPRKRVERPIGVVPVTDLQELLVGGRPVPGVRRRPDVDLRDGEVEREVAFVDQVELGGERQQIRGHRLGVAREVGEQLLVGFEDEARLLKARDLRCGGPRARL